jgi:N-methylhydantoinase A
MEAEAARELPGCEPQRQADLRYRGQSFELTVPVSSPSLEALGACFHAEHARRYGYRMEGETVELVNLRLVATIPGEKPELRALAPAASGERGRGRRPANLDGAWLEVDVVERASLAPGARVDGPAVVAFPEATCLLRPGWRGTVDEVGTLVLERG